MFGSNMGEWLLQGAGWWAVELRASGTLVGNIGAFFRESWPEVEIGWNTFPAYRGQGIATEAAAEVVRCVVITDSARAGAPSRTRKGM